MKLDRRLASLSGSVRKALWLCVLLAFLPRLVSLLGGHGSLATEVIIYALFAMSFNLLLGYTGLGSFGHAAYLGIGAYVVAICQVRGIGSLGLWLTLAALITAGFAAVVGALVSGKRGVYFGLLTLAFGQMFYFVAFRWDSVTGGETGLTGLARDPVSLLPGITLDLSNEVVFYYFVLVIFLLCLFLMWRIINSPFGRVLAAIKGNELRARFLGYRTGVYKWAIFTLAGAFAGLAGGLYALQHYAAFPSYLYWTESGNAVMATLVGGGLSSFFGPILGAGLFIVLQDLISALTERWMLIFGLVFIFVVLVIPEGLLGALEGLGMRLRDAAVSLLGGAKEERAHGHTAD